MTGGKNFELVSIAKGTGGASRPGIMPTAIFATHRSDIPLGTRLPDEDASNRESRFEQDGWCSGRGGREGCEAFRSLRSDTSPR